MNEEEATLEDYAFLTIAGDEPLKMLEDVSIGDTYGLIVVAVEDGEVRFNLKKI